MNTRWLTLVSLVCVAILSRFIPHPWNFTAIGAMALFGGAHFESKKVSLLVPFLALILSDCVLGFHNTILYVYGAFALTVVLGWTLHEKKSVFKVATYSLVASTLFFAISNFGVWMAEPMYSKNLAGLVDCYVMAIPFFGNQIAGDLFYTGVMFGAFAWLQKQVPAINKV